MIHTDLLDDYIINQRQIRLQKKSHRVNSFLSNIAKRINLRLQSLTILLACVSLISFMSCSSDDTDEIDKRKEFTQIVENRSAKDLLNDLYVGSDGDIQSLARMLNVTPSSIERLRKGETEPTDKFDKRIKEVAIYYYLHDRSYRQLRACLKDARWYEYLIWFVIDNPGWFIFDFILSLCISLIIAEEFPLLAILWGIMFIVYIVAAVFYFCVTPAKMDDKYIDTINPTIEVLI